jgi:hypothetical protein
MQSTVIVSYCAVHVNTFGSDARGKDGVSVLIQSGCCYCFCEHVGLVMKGPHIGSFGTTH